MYANCGSLEDAKTAFEGIRQPNVFSWNIMLSAYAQNGYIDEARKLFDRMEKRDVVSWTTLFSGYAQMGYVDEAREFFDKMGQHSDVSWSSMIAAYAQNGYPWKALELFRLMGVEGVKPRTSCWVSVLDACGSALAVKDGEVFYQAVKESGLEVVVAVGTALVGMFGKFGRPEESCMVFDGICVKNTVSWNALISAFAQNGRFREAIWVLHSMCVDGVGLDAVTFLNAFSVFSKAPTMAFEGQCWYGRLLEAGFSFDCSLETAVVNMFVHCGRLDKALSIFNNMPERSAVTWTIVIRACGESGDFKGALKTLALMDQDGVRADRVVILSVLEACSSSPTFTSLEQVRRLHTDVVQGTGFHSDSKVGTLLIVLYSRCGSLEKATSCFDDIHRGGVASWTAMIEAYIQSGHYLQALELFSAMDLEGIRPDSITFASVLSVCANSGARQQGQAIHAAILDAGIDTTGAVGISLVEMYQRCGSVTESTRILSTMREFSIERLVAELHCQRMDEKKVAEVLRVMDMEGSSIDREGAISIASACWQSSIARTIHARVLDSDWIHDEQRRDSNLVAALINMHGRSGNVREARRVFDKLRGSRDTVVWTSLMAAYSRDNGVESCAEIFNLLAAMTLEGVDPSAISFIVVITACSHSGMLGRAIDCLENMFQDYGIEVSDYHLACVGDLFGRAGEEKRFVL